MKKPGWNHIIVEGFCMRTTSPKKDKYVYELVSMEPYKTKKIKNPSYDPKYKIPKRPTYCKNKVIDICLMNECPHLAIGDSTLKVKAYMAKCMKELWDNPEDETWDDILEDEKEIKEWNDTVINAKKKMMKESLEEKEMSKDKCIWEKKGFSILLGSALIIIILAILAYGIVGIIVGPIVGLPVGMILSFELGGWD